METHLRTIGLNHPEMDFGGDAILVGLHESGHDGGFQLCVNLDKMSELFVQQAGKR